MSQTKWQVRPALFDVLSGTVQNSLTDEITRIMTSRHLSYEFDGLVSDFGIPVFETTLPEYKKYVEKKIAEHVMRFEPRLKKITVYVTEMIDGKIKVQMDLFTQLENASIPLSLVLSR